MTSPEMLARNLQTVSRLIKALKSELPADALADLIVFGSAAITLRGKDLRRPVGDLDLFVSAERYTELKAQPRLTEIEKKPGVTALLTHAPQIEIWKAFPAMDYAEVFRRSTPTDHSEGLRVADLEHLILWKNAQGRSKDKADLERIQG